MSTCTLIKGASATGKSTRMNYIVRQLGDTFIVLKEEYPEWHKKAGKFWEVGRLYPDMNLIVMGAWRPKVGRFDSMDYIHSNAGKTKYVDEILSHYTDYDVIGEGYPLMNSFRRRGVHLIDEIGFENAREIFVFYPDTDAGKDECLKRLVGRGSKINTLEKLLDSNVWDANERRQIELAYEEAGDRDDIKIREVDAGEPVEYLWEKLFQ